MKKWICSFILLFVFVQSVSAELQPLPRNDLAIVIDDLGNNMKGTKEILSFPVKLTVAIMPFMPSTKEDAELANKNGHQVIVHLPMEPKSGEQSWLGPGAITTDLSDGEVRKRVEEAIKDVPYAVGMNNHMGSKVTEDERIMGIILDVCKKHGFFFLDSKTSPNSVVGRLANEKNVPFLVNNIFFDDIYTSQHIRKQADILANSLTKVTPVIAIGHVGVSGSMMYNVLKEYIPKYENMARFVTLSELIPEYKWIDKDLE